MVWAAVVWSSEGKSPSSRHGQNLQSQRGLAFGLGPLFFGERYGTYGAGVCQNLRAKELAQAAGRIGGGRHRGGCPCGCWVLGEGWGGRRGGGRAGVFVWGGFAAGRAVSLSRVFLAPACQV